VVPKMWIPVTNQVVLNELADKGRQLAKELLAGHLSERPFKARMPKIYPELSYFTANAEDLQMQTYCAMLSVFWLLNDQLGAFVRAQVVEDRLSQQSWAWVQEWMKETVRLQTDEVVDAMITFMAIHALGKLTEFREELAPGFDEKRHDLALEHILRTKPEVVPSFMRLSPKYQTLIIDSLSVDFEFGQFLQAENVPANLVVVKEKLAPHGEDGFAFFCFRIFAQMCGKLGAEGLQGSLFMTETQFLRFRPGIDALQKLKTNEAATAYNAFLLLQGSKALSRFASPEHQALARLLCLASANDHASGDTVKEAFDDLPVADKRQLTRWLTNDGIHQKPGYVLCAAPELLRNAQANPAVGLAAAMRMLVRVQERCDAAASLRFSTLKVYVHLKDLAMWANEAGGVAGEFDQARLEVRTEDLGDTRVFTIQVVRPLRLDGPSSSLGADTCCSRCCSCMRCMFMFTLLLTLLGCVFAGLCLRIKPKIAEPYLEQAGGVEPRVALRGLGATAIACFGLLTLMCCRSCLQDPCSCRASGSSSCSGCGCPPRIPGLGCDYHGCDYTKLESDFI